MRLKISTLKINQMEEPMLLMSTGLNPVFFFLFALLMVGMISDLINLKGDYLINLKGDFLIVSSIIQFFFLLMSQDEEPQFHLQHV